MSNIYIQEPPTSGKVLLITSVGDIDVELWSKECPKACRNFIQLCLEGYYNNTIFHRVVKGFIVQGGDPNGDGTGGKSIYEEPFKDEFHTRLRYTRRGLVGMANSGSNDNGSQFFFTMGAATELENKHTLFGKVTGDTVFNMLKLEDGIVDHNERPLYPHKIIQTEVLNNPFPDIEPRISKRKHKIVAKEVRKKEKGVKNFGLLSFGEQAEEDEEKTNEFTQRNIRKAKSIHDVIEDPTLSKEAIKIETFAGCLTEDDVLLAKKDSERDEDRVQRIKDKLKFSKALSNKLSIETELTVQKEIDLETEDDVLMTHDNEKKRVNNLKKQQIRDEIQLLKKSYQMGKRKVENLSSEDKDMVSSVKMAKDSDNELVQSLVEEKLKYSKLKSQVPVKGVAREEFTLNLLKKFRNKLDAIKHKLPTDKDNENVNDYDLDDITVDKEIQEDDWLAHTFRFQEAVAVPVFAKDASTKSDDWYDMNDPRNPINKRRRGADKKCSKKYLKHSH